MEKHEYQTVTTNRSTLIEAQGTWLRGFAWDWYGTFTFARPVTAIGARFVLNQYVHSLKAASGTAVNMYWAAERGPRGGNIHAHALIGNVGTLEPCCDREWNTCTSRCGVHLWRSGEARIGIYSPERAATFYVSKNAFLRLGNADSIANGDWDIIGTPMPIKTG